MGEGEGEGGIEILSLYSRDMLPRWLFVTNVGIFHGQLDINCLVAI